MWPDARPGDMPGNHDNPNRANPHWAALCSDVTYWCRSCGRETRWLDCSFECAICSPDCAEAMWRRYSQALENIPCSN